MIIGNNFNDIYDKLLKKLHDVGTRTTNRKGAQLAELFDESFRLDEPLKCLALCRELSNEYLEKEFAFYISGSNKLKDAMDCSKFWEKCSDDGETINSNYGKLIFHDVNFKGTTQFNHAVDCLVNNPHSKKAVMTLYTDDHAYISNDNPCTMFLRARIDNDWKLHLSTYMRSSDVYFGLPYDVPWFVFVQYVLYRVLLSKYPKLRMGTYTHHACTLHKYTAKASEIARARNMYSDSYAATFVDYILQLFKKSFGALKPLVMREIDHSTNMKLAWDYTSNSTCLKKKVGGMLVVDGHNFLNCGSPNSVQCTSCVREDVDDPYYGDECPSVHAEMKLITEALTYGIKDFSNAILYTTHGPCDACLKFCDLVGIQTVIYDKPYKTNYNHWPNIRVFKLDELP